MRHVPCPGDVQGFVGAVRGSRTALTSPAAWGKEGCVLAWQAMGKGDPHQGQNEITVLLSCSLSLWMTQALLPSLVLKAESG